MIEIPDGMSDEEFKEFYRSKTDAQRIEIDRALARLARDGGFLTEAEYAERAAKIDRHEKLIEDQKRVHELLHRVETAEQLVEDRLNARIADIMETDSAHFLDAKKRRSN